MQFDINRDLLLKSLNFVQGVVEKKNTLHILSNVILKLKETKLTIVAKDLDVIFYDELSDVKIIKEGSTTTSATILYDILRKISANSEIKFDLKSENKLSLKRLIWKHLNLNMGHLIQNHHQSINTSNILINKTKQKYF